LLYVTNLGHISLISVRTAAIRWTATQPITLGRPTACCLDSKHIWLVIGTSSGNLALWDLRYGLLVRHWQVSEAAVTVIAGHPARGRGKWVVVASQMRSSESAGSQPVTIMISVDLSTGEITERFQTTTSTSSAASTGSKAKKVPPDYLESAPAVETPAYAIEKLLADRPEIQLPKINTNDQHQHHATCSIQAIHPLEILAGDTSFSNSTDLSPVQETFETTHGQERPAALPAGIILTVSQDRIVRLWNLGQPAQSLVVSGAGKDANKRYRHVWLSEYNALAPFLICRVPTCRHIRGSDGAISYIESPYRAQEVRQPQSRVSRKLAEEEQTSAIPSGTSTASVTRPHLHETTAVLPFTTPFSNALMIATADAGGVVKVWKVEG
jgi:phosphoinositide-3-kinase regulatory subunit 4